MNNIGVEYTRRRVQVYKLRLKTLETRTFKTEIYLFHAATLYMRYLARVTKSKSSMIIIYRPTELLRTAFQPL